MKIVIKIIALVLGIITLFAILSGLGVYAYHRFNIKPTTKTDAQSIEESPIVAESSPTMPGIIIRPSPISTMPSIIESSPISTMPSIIESSPPPPQTSPVPVTINWTKVNGIFKQVVHNGTAVCAIRPDNTLWYKNSFTGSDWLRIPGTRTLKQISIYNNSICGVDESNNVYYASDFRNPEWKKMAQPLKQVSHFVRTFCGVDTSGNVWVKDTINFDADITASDWSKLDPGVSSMKQVSINDYVIYGINPDNRVYYCNRIGYTGWRQIADPFRLVYVSNGGKYVCGIDSSGNVWCKDSIKGTLESDWYKLPALTEGNLVDVCLYGDKLYGVDYTNQVYYKLNIDARDYDATRQSGSPWTQLSGVFKQASHSGSFACAVNPQNNIYCKDNLETPEWNVVAGAYLKQVSTADDSTSKILCGVDENNTIKCTNDYKKPDWKSVTPPIGVNFRQVSRDKNTICAIDQNNKLWMKGIATDTDYTSPNGWWIFPDQQLSFKQVSINNGIIYVTDFNNDVYYGYRIGFEGWTKIDSPIKFKYVSNGQSSVCGITPGDNILCRDNITSTRGDNWYEISKPPGSIENISLNNNKLMGVNERYSVFYKSDIF